jgi:hypothetical protein
MSIRRQGRGAGVGGLGIRCDVSQENDMKAGSRHAGEYGAVDGCQPAIIGRRLDAALKEWRRTMDVNFMAHVLARGDASHDQQAAVIVAATSAAGLMRSLGDLLGLEARRSGLAEWLSVNSPSAVSGFLPVPAGRAHGTARPTGDRRPSL